MVWWLIRGAGALSIVYVTERLFRRAPLRSANVSRPRQRHVQDLGGRQILRVRLVQIIVTLCVLRNAIVGADRNLSGRHAGYLKTTLLLNLRSSRSERLRRDLRLGEQVKAVRRLLGTWRRRPRRRCGMHYCGRLVIISRDKITAYARTCH